MEYIFLEYRKFVTHPFYAKATVSEAFRTDSNFKLPQPNMCPRHFSDAKNTIKEFLVPMQTFYVCPRDCVVFRKDYEKLEKCPVCSSDRYKKNGRPGKVLSTFLEVQESPVFIKIKICVSYYALVLQTARQAP